MARPRVSYEITSKDRSGKGISDAKKGVSSLAKTGVKSAAKMAAGYAAVFLSIKQITQGIGEALRAYGEQEQAEIRLAAAARNNPLINGDSVRGIREYASALQEASIFGDEAILQQASFLTSLQMSEDQIRHVLGAATDLASTGMMSLESAVRNIAKSYSGMSGELGELIPQLRDLTEEELKAGAAADVIAEQFDGMAESVANSSAGMKQQFQNMWGDFAENVGEALAPLQKTVLQKLGPILDGISNWVRDHSRQITNFFLNFGELAALTFGAVKAGLIESFKMENIISNVKAAATHIGNVFRALIPFLASLFWRLAQSYVEYMKRALQSIWDILKRVGRTIWSPLTAGFEWVIYGIKVAWRGTMGFFGRAIDWLVEGPINWIGEAFHNIIQGIKIGFEAAINGIIAGLNFVLRPLDRILFLIGQIDQHGMKFGQYDEYVPGQGMGGVSIGEVDFDTSEWEDLSSDVADRWEYAISPPDRNVGQEIADAWEGTGVALVDIWEGFGDTIGGYWEGFGEEFRDTFGAIGGSLTDFYAHISGPFREAFQQIAPEMEALMNEELPFELRSTVESMIDALDEEGQAAVREAFAAYEGSWQPDYGQGAGGGASMSRLWNLYMELQFKKISAKLGEVWENLKDGVGRIKDGFVDAGRFIGRMFTEPQEAIAEAGFFLVRTIRNIGEGVREAGPRIKAALGEAASAVGQAAMSVGAWLWDMISGTEAFQEALKIVSDTIGYLFEDLAAPLIQALEPIFQIIIQLVGVLGDVLMPVIQGLANIILRLSPVFEALGTLVEAIGNVLMQLLPVVQMVADVLVALLIPIIDVLAQALGIIADFIAQIMPVIQVILEAVVNILTPVIEFIGELLNIIAPVLEMVGEILLALAPIIEVIGLVLADVLGPALEFVGEILTVVLTPVLEILAGLMAVITPLFDILAKIIRAFTPILTVIFNILTALAGLFEVFGVMVGAVTPLLELLGLILSALTPVIEVFALVIDAVTRPLEFLADVITYVVDVFKAVGHNIVQFLLSVISFGTAGGDYVGMPTFSSDAFSRPLGEYGDGGTTIDMPTIDDVTTGESGMPAVGGGAGTGGRAAQYGGTELHVNVYIETEAVVGEPGLREFALMINDEIMSARQLGLVS